MRILIHVLSCLLGIFIGGSLAYRQSSGSAAELQTCIADGTALAAEAARLQLQQRDIESQLTVLLEPDPGKVALAGLVGSLIHLPGASPAAAGMVPATQPRWIVPAKIKPILLAGGGAYKWCSGKVCSDALQPEKASVTR